LNKVALIALAALAAGCGKSSAGEDRPGATNDAAGYYDNEDSADVNAGEPAAGDAQQMAMAMQQPRGAAAQGQQRRGNVMRFIPGVIVDAVGFGQPVAAASLFVPYGWRQEGGVVWGREHMCTNGYNFDWRATAPDGSSGVMLLPQMKWENNSYGAAPSTPGCSNAPFNSARAYLDFLAQTVFPGGRVIDYRDRPDLVQQFGGQATRTPMAMGESRLWAEAGEALVAFSANGREMRGSVAAVVSFQQMITDMSGMMANDPAAAMGVPQMGPSRMEALTGFAQPGWAAYAPNGQFNFGFFEGIRRSIEPNRQWSSAIVNHNVKIGQVALAESKKRAAAVMEANDYISRLQQETWNARQASAERQLREFGEMMKGVETYRDVDAPGGTVELDHRYNHAWRMRDGSYIITDDPNFDPWRDLQLEGRKLEAVQ
jgi:hypothetical protein